MHELPNPERKLDTRVPKDGARERPASLSPTYSETPFYGSGDESWDREETDLLKYWGTLKKRKGTILLLAVLGGVAGFLLTLPQTPIYQARTTLEVVPLNQDFLNAKEASPYGEASASNDIPTQVEMLQSRSLLDRVVKRLGQTAPSSQEPASRTTAWRQALNLPEPTPVEAREQAIASALNSLQIQGTGQTRLVEVTVDSTDPSIAATFANTLTSEYINQLMEARLDTSEKTSEFLSRQIDDIRIRLEQSEDRLQQYAQRAGLVFTESNSNVSEDRLLQLQQSLSEAQADRIAKQSRWEMVESSSPESLPDIINDQTLRQYQAELTDLERQLAELRQVFTDETTQVKRILAQIPPLEQQLTRERDDIITRIRNEYEEAVRREELLQTDYDQQRDVVSGEGERSIQYNILKREVDSNRQLYDALLQQLKQAGLASALQASNVRVVDPAVAPEYPYKPDIIRSSAFGFLAGIGFAVGFVILQERTNRSIQDPGETQGYLGLPELGIIPSSKPVSRLSGKKAIGAPGREVTSTANLVDPKAENYDRIELAAFQQRTTTLAEAFRSTLTSILFSETNDTRPRVLAITSANPGEGKTTVTSNLAIALAEVSHRVLLIDADMRRPRLHEIFNLNNNCGLSDLLRPTEAYADLPPGLIQESAIPNLYVMTSGAQTSSATTLLHSRRLPDALSKLRREFETILIDTPPMLQIPDARIVGRMADQVILIIRSGKTTRDAALAARHRFAEDGVDVLGTILNDWNPNSSGNGYYSYYKGYNDYYKSYYSPSAD